MNRTLIHSGVRTSLFAGAALLAAPVLAQEAPVETSAEAPMDEPAEVTAAPEVNEATPPKPFAASEADAAKTCELHIWPTENYIGIKMGLLSGFGPIGALADMEVNKGKVLTVKDLMREFLGPDVQLGALEELKVREQLGLSADEYRVVIQKPTPWNEDLKDNPELKAEVKQLNKDLKGSVRLSDSTTPCYAELVGTHIMYHKAMMYGSNLFSGWHFRKFEGDKVVKRGKGQVKNPLEEFPPKEEAQVEVAKLELIDAYSKDFTEYVEKKVNKKRRSRR